MNEGGWITAYDMFYEIFEHGVTYVRVGCADNVWATCNGHGQGELVTA